MAWTTGPDLLQYAADQLAVDIAALPDKWARQAAAAVNIAYTNLVAYIAELGYSAGQIVTFDNAADLNLAQGLYELAGLGAGYGDYPREWFDRFDLVTQWTERKRRCVLISQGVPLAPDGSSAIGGISSGTTDAVSQTAHEYDRRNHHRRW